MRQAVGNLDPKFIAGTLFGSIPTLMDIYARYSKGKETARLIDAQKAVDGIPLTDKDIDIFTPAKRSIEEIKNSYTPPHCKRHFFTDRDGKVRSVLVCTDSAGTRSYFNH